jgi:hypothetical protein
MFILPMGDLLQGKFVMLGKMFDVFNQKLTRYTPNKVMTLSIRKGYTTDVGRNKSAGWCKSSICEFRPLTVD